MQLFLSLHNFPVLHCKSNSEFYFLTFFSGSSSNHAFCSQIQFFFRWDQRTRNYEKRFALQLRGTKLCLQSQGGVTEKKSGIALGYCLGKTKSQSWYKTDKSELVLAKLLCLDSTKKQPRLMKCHELGGTQVFFFSFSVQQNISLSREIEFMQFFIGFLISIITCTQYFRNGKCAKMGKRRQFITWPPDYV